MDGILNIYKEKGFTSHDVVAVMRGILKIKKIGHTGTLDPDAEGVLPVCIGRATKLVDLITDKDKTYETVLKLGVITDTQDMTGSVIKASEVDVELEAIMKAAEHFIGEYEQLPPMYSAIKINGRRLYDLARQGIEVERKTRRVSIHDIRLLGYDKELHEVSLAVDCGKGTYIRTLLHDIGELLGCGGTMKSLLRTKVGAFRLESALRLSEVESLFKEGQIIPHITPIEEMFVNYPGIIIGNEYDKLIHNGNPFSIEHIDKGINAGDMLDATSGMSAFIIDNEACKAIGNEAGKVIDNDTDKAIDNEACKAIDNEACKAIGNEACKAIDNDTDKAIDIRLDSQYNYNTIVKLLKQDMIRVYDSQCLFVGMYSFNTDKDLFVPYKMFL